LNCVLKIFFLTALLVLSGTGSARAACSTPTANVGAREYFTATNNFKFCDGTNWVNLQVTAMSYKDGTEISTGTGTTCAIRSDGAAMCWGSNAYGQLGNGATGNVNTPSLLPGDSTWRAIAAGAYTSFYDISTWTWGVNISRGCGIKSGGALWCWGNGNDNYGCSGTWPTGSVSSTPTLFDSGSWTHISTRLSTTIETMAASCPPYPPDQRAENFCGIKSNGTAWCWGDNTDGQLGNGTTTLSNTPVQVSGGSAWKTINVGGGDLNNTYACGIKSDDTLWCWGKNAGGQLGIGNTTSQSSPVAVGGTWKMVSAGVYSTCGIKTDNTAWCWGVQSFGRLGNGVTSGNQTTPVAVSGGSTWIDINVGFEHACGIKSDNTAWCWGRGMNGRLGNAGTADSSTPVAVSGGASWKQISAATYHTCGVRTDGTLWCWGGGTPGNLGDGTNTATQTTPVAVSGGYTWKTGCTAGTFDYYSSNKFKYCIGDSWVDVNCSSGGCGALGACTQAGATGYVGTKYAYCNGSNWQALAP